MGDETLAEEYEVVCCADCWFCLIRNDGAPYCCYYPGQFGFGTEITGDVGNRAEFCKVRRVLVISEEE